MMKKFGIGRNSTKALSQDSSQLPHDVHLNTRAGVDRPDVISERPVLDHYTLFELRRACALILQETGPSDEDYAAILNQPDPLEVYHRDQLEIQEVREQASQSQTSLPQRYSTRSKRDSKHYREDIKELNRLSRPEDPYDDPYDAKPLPSTRGAAERDYGPAKYLEKVEKKSKSKRKSSKKDPEGKESKHKSEPDLKQRSEREKKSRSDGEKKRRSEKHPRTYSRPKGNESNDGQTPQSGIEELPPPKAIRPDLQDQRIPSHSSHASRAPIPADELPPGGRDNQKRRTDPRAPVRGMMAHEFEMRNNREHRISTLNPDYASVPTLFPTVYRPPDPQQPLHQVEEIPSSTPGSRPESRASSLFSSIRNGFRDYVKPRPSLASTRNQSRDVSRTVSRSDSRTASHVSSRPGSRADTFSSASRNWFGLRRKTSWSSFRSGDDLGDEKAQGRERGPDLNRSLPPLPGLDQYKEPKKHIVHLMSQGGGNPNEITSPTSAGVEQKAVSPFPAPELKRDESWIDTRPSPPSTADATSPTHDERSVSPISERKPSFPLGHEPAIERTEMAPDARVPSTKVRKSQIERAPSSADKKKTSEDRKKERKELKEKREEEERRAQREKIERKEKREQEEKRQQQEKRDQELKKIEDEKRAQQEKKEKEQREKRELRETRERKEKQEQDERREQREKREQKEKKDQEDRKAMKEKKEQDEKRARREKQEQKEKREQEEKQAIREKQEQKERKEQEEVRAQKERREQKEKKEQDERREQRERRELKEKKEQDERRELREKREKEHEEKREKENEERRARKEKKEKEQQDRKSRDSSKKAPTERRPKLQKKRSSASNRRSPAPTSPLSPPIPPLSPDIFTTKVNTKSPQLPELRFSYLDEQPPPVPAKNSPGPDTLSKVAETNEPVSNKNGFVLEINSPTLDDTATSSQAKASSSSKPESGKATTSGAEVNSKDETQLPVESKSSVKAAPRREEDPKMEANLKDLRDLEGKTQVNDRATPIHEGWPVDKAGSPAGEQPPQSAPDTDIAAGRVSDAGNSWFGTDTEETSTDARPTEEEPVTPTHQPSMEAANGTTEHAVVSEITKLPSEREKTPEPTDRNATHISKSAEETTEAEQEETSQQSVKVGTLPEQQRPEAAASEMKSATLLEPTTYEDTMNHLSPRDNADNEPDRKSRMSDSVEVPIVMMSPVSPESTWKESPATRRSSSSSFELLSARSFPISPPMHTPALVSPAIQSPAIRSPAVESPPVLQSPKLESLPPVESPPMRSPSDGSMKMRIPFSGDDSMPASRVVSTFEPNYLDLEVKRRLQAGKVSSPLAQSHGTSALAAATADTRRTVASPQPGFRDEPQTDQSKSKSKTKATKLKEKNKDKAKGKSSTKDAIPLSLGRGNDAPTPPAKSPRTLEYAEQRRIASTLDEHTGDENGTGPDSDADAHRTILEREGMAHGQMSVPKTRELVGAGALVGIEDGRQLRAAPMSSAENIHGEQRWTAEQRSQQQQRAAWKPRAQHGAIASQQQFGGDGHDTDLETASYIEPTAAGSFMEGGRASKTQRAGSVDIGYVGMGGPNQARTDAGTNPMSPTSPTSSSKHHRQNSAQQKPRKGLRNRLSRLLGGSGGAQAQQQQQGSVTTAG